jgi:hypothetical protein
VLDLIVDGLAVYRLTRLLTTDKVTEGLREQMFLLDVRWAAHRDRPVREFWGYLARCDWCVSIYAAAVVRFMPRRIRRALALSALAGIVSTRVPRRGADLTR